MATKKKFHISEAEFLHMILDTFKDDRNILMFRRNVGGCKIKNESGNERYVRFGQPGMSDIEGIVKEYRCSFCNRLQHGVHFELEVKGTDGKLSSHQEKWLKHISEFNGILNILKQWTI